ncbi:MAG: hypothetical protein GIKADHBN_01165 [Phycisphaerales bacterium]|nr:hypothetical protein [Phycisphaerales bacterium]
MSKSLMLSLAVAALAGVCSFVRGGSSGPQARAEGVTLRSLLEEMIDRDAIARFPSPAYTCRQASSYDRASTSPTNAETWFANRDHGQFIRMEENAGRQEWVLMDEAGPGAVVRFWSANPDGTIRVYLDGGSQPVIETPMKDFLTGKWKVDAPLAGVRSNGANLHLPIPYARHCKITCDSNKFYYQINFRTYEPGTKVTTFAPDQVDEAAPSIEVVKSALTTPPKYAAEPIMLFQGALTPESSVTRNLPPGPAAVQRLWVTVQADDMEEAMRTVVLRMKFDGEETVWCPLGDFFCSGIGFNPMDSWYTAVKGENQLISRWTMPYAKAAEVSLENLGTATVTVGLAHRSSSWTFDDRSMHFWARWTQKRPIPTRPMSDFNYVEITGKGVYVGDLLDIFNPVPEWWGEGDEKIYVDGETFPSHFGTGTEDYYGYAWSSPKKFQHAFHGQPRSDGEPANNTRGYSTIFRTRALDAIPFTKGLKVDMEVWHWVECEVGYSAATFFYARPGAVTNRPPQPAEAAKGVPPVPPPPPPFRVEGAVECEQLVVKGSGKATAAVAQDMQGFGRNTWSNDSQLWVQGKETGAFVELEVPAPGPGKHGLTLYATKSWDYGIVKVTVNGEAAKGSAGTGYDLYSGRQGVAVSTGPIDLGAFVPRDGKYLLRVEVIGANEKAVGTGSFFGLDCVVVSPAK